MMKNLKLIFPVVVCAVFAALFLSGCASVPATKGFTTTYYINGTNYFPLGPFCDSRNIDLQYDTFARTIVLSRDSHRVSMRVGDTFVLADGSPMHLNHPVDIYQGVVVCPYKFKQQVLDSLFKEYYPAERKGRLACSRIKKIIIDAGHGGNDPGAIGKSGVREKDVNLDIAKRLSAILKNEGVEVVMTRSTDRFIPLDTRVRIANDSHADLFVSIHSNANRVRSMNGFEIYYVASSVSDTKRALFSARHAALDLDSSCFASRSLDLQATLWDMIYTNSRAESIELSRAICHSMDSDLGAKILGIKGARYEVLRGVRMPAVLIETGFLSNGSEENMLKNSYYRQKIAEAVAQGIGNYAGDFTLMEAKKK